MFGFHGVWKESRGGVQGEGDGDGDREGGMSVGGRGRRFMFVQKVLQPIEKKKNKNKLSNNQKWRHLLWKTFTHDQQIKKEAT